MRAGLLYVMYVVKGGTVQKRQDFFDTLIEMIRREVYEELWVKETVQRWYGTIQMGDQERKGRHSHR